MLALVIIAAVPLVAFASANIGLQRTVTNDHAALGHYGFMAAFSFTVLGAGLLASLRPDGWRLTAWVAGFLPVLLGLASLVFPDVDSSLGLVWAFAAVTWGVGFVAAAELTRDPERPTLLSSRGVISNRNRVERRLRIQLVADAGALLLELVATGDTTAHPAAPATPAGAADSGEPFTPPRVGIL